MRCDWQASHSRRDLREGVLGIGEGLRTRLTRLLRGTYGAIASAAPILTVAKTLASERICTNVYRNDLDRYVMKLSPYI